MTTRIYSRSLLALATCAFCIVFVSSALVRTSGALEQQASTSGGSRLVRRVGEVPVLARRENLTANMTPDEQIRMLMTFQIRHEARLQRFLAQVYDPASPLYHHWMTAEEFGQRFGRTQDEFNHALAWLQGQGMQVDRTYPNRLAIGFTGTADAVGKAFQVELGRYWDSERERAFYSNKSTPTLPPEIDSITIGLVGLNDAQLFHRPARRSSLVPLSPQQRTQVEDGGFKPEGKIGSSLVLFPKDLALLYDYQPIWNSNVKGQNQKVGVIIDSDIRDSDMNTYRSTTGLSPLTVTRVLYPGFSNPGFTAGEVEADLDTESISAAAPSAEIDLILIPNLSFVAIGTAEQDVVNQGTIKIVSESLGICESQGFLTSEQNIYNQAAAQGIGFFASSGDEGANCDESDLSPHGVECPACYANVTGVGGTTVNANFDSQGNVTSRASEPVWNRAPGVRQNCTGGNTGGGAGGGGVAQNVPIPAFQSSSQGFVGGVPAGTLRSVPDIAAIADPQPIGALLVNQGSLFYGGGTSQSSPLVAGMMALINQFLGSSQGSPNTAFYQLGVNQYKNGGPHAFIDVTSGNNNVAPVSPCLPAGWTGFAAGTGFDRVTGWGGPDVSVIAQSLGGTHQYQGFHDGAGCNTISGWAWDATNPNGAVSVDIYDGNTFIATTSANMYREDLLNALGSPNHGFSFLTPASLKNGAVHTINVKFSGTNTLLSNTGRTNQCSLPSNFFGRHDGQGCNAIEGWAWDGNDPNGTVNVDIYDGTTLIGTVACTLYRQDLADVLGSPYHGFIFHTPASLRDGQPHTITVKFGGTNTNLTLDTPRTTSCTSSTTNYQGNLDIANCSTISGYAWDVNDDQGTINAAIYVDGGFFVVVPAQEAYPGIGTGYHGFRFAVPASLKNGQPHSIQVKFSGTSTNLSGTPKSITCP
jgi:Pro-kumamolisin, activation domain/Subtilase family